MRSIITLSMACFMLMGTENINAIRIKSEVSFVDDIVRMLDESEKKEAAEAKLAQANCNPCPTSAAGPNPHYEAEGNADAKKNMEAAAVAAAAAGKASNPEADIESENKDDKPALAQAHCNPCPDSAAGANPNYKVGGDAKDDDKADTEGKKVEADDKKDALSQVNCNPCPDSAAGKNPHYPSTPPKTSAAEAKADALAQKQEPDVVMDIEAVKAYSGVIAEAAEENEPEHPVIYTETITN